jgi:hypothetical protein
VWLSLSGGVTCLPQQIVDEAQLCDDRWNKDFRDQVQQSHRPVHFVQHDSQMDVSADHVRKFGGCRIETRTDTCETARQVRIQTFLTNLDFIARFRRRRSLLSVVAVDEADVVDRRLTVPID